MKNKSSIMLCTVLGTMVGAGLGIIASKSMSCKHTTLKKTAGKALRTAGSFIEHMSF